jgi:hypothetical protein
MVKTLFMPGLSGMGRQYPKFGFMIIMATL